MCRYDRHQHNNAVCLKELFRGRGKEGEGGRWAKFGVFTVYEMVGG